MASIIAGDIDSRHVKKDIWSCLTCGICYERCPSDVNFPEFIRDIRCSLSGSKDDEKCQARLEEETREDINRFELMDIE